MQPSAAGQLESSHRALGQQHSSASICSLDFTACKDNLVVAGLLRNLKATGNVGVLSQDMYASDLENVGCRAVLAQTPCRASVVCFENAGVVCRLLDVSQLNVISRFDHVTYLHSSSSSCFEERQSSSSSHLSIAFLLPCLPHASWCNFSCSAFDWHRQSSELCRGWSMVTGMKELTHGPS